MSRSLPVAPCVRLLTVGVVALLLAPGALGQEDLPRYAIRAGKIVTLAEGDQSTVDHGVVLVSNGEIEAVGPADEIEVPEGYTVIDATDRWVMPGMVEIHSHCGVDGGLNDMVSQINPGMRIGDGVDVDSETARLSLASGITTIQTVPGSGTNHGGFGVAFKTAGATKQDRLIRRISIMKCTQAYNPERGAGDIGATRMGMAWVLREHLSNAKAYADAWAAYGSGETAERPERDLALEPVQAVFRGEIPVLVHTYETWGVLMSMGMFCDEFGVKAIATHAAYNGHRAAEQVAAPGYSINIGPRVVDFYGRGEARFDGMVPTYCQGGVTDISVNTDQFGLGQVFLANKAAMAARFGLEGFDALKLVTINAARAILLDDRIGSIEAGKDADLVVKASGLLDPTTPVEMVFVNGRLAYERDAKGRAND